MLGCGMWDVGCGMWDVGCGFVVTNRGESLKFNHSLINFSKRLSPTASSNVPPLTLGVYANDH
jgi:hypothetical protein